MLTVKLLFWSSVALLAYTYIGYAALIWAWSRLRPRPVLRAAIDPPISVVIVAHNEAHWIEDKIRNLLTIDHPKGHLEILVGSDGSTDGTDDLVRAFEQAGVTSVIFETRRGKAAVLNDLIPRARGEIVILADARQQLETGSLQALIRPFRDPRVGAVSGELTLTGASDGPEIAQGVSTYWRYEKLIRRSESEVDSAVGATGAIYAIRRALFEPIPEDTILDDVLIPLRIARRGYRVLFEPRARAYERAATSPREEFARKVRTLAGNFQLFAREPWLLNPMQNRLCLQTFSHKALRLVAPLLQATILATNLLLAAEPIYRVTLAAQLLFFAAGVGGHTLQIANRRNPILALPYTLCFLTWATMVGFFRYVTGRQRITWEKPVS